MDSSGFNESLYRKTNANISDIFYSSPETSVCAKKSCRELLNHTNKSTDSFFVPETQQIDESLHVKSKTNHNQNDTIESNATHLNRTDDEFCIPETQQPDEIFLKPADVSDKLPNQLMASSLENEGNEESESQFRICTQDFNLDYEGNDNSNGSLNLSTHGATEPQFSMVIPKITHEPVELFNSNDAELENLNWSLEKENSLHQRDDTCTPDLFDFPVLGEELKKKNSNANNSIKIESTKETSKDEDLMPTQVFVSTKQKPMQSVDISSTADHSSSSDKENFLIPPIVVKEKLVGLIKREDAQVLPDTKLNDSDEDLMATQAFIAPTKKANINPTEEKGNVYFFKDFLY